MPGYVEPESYARCLECDGPDVGNAGSFLHYPICSTQEGHEQARKDKAEAKAQRRRERDELVASPEAARLRELRHVERLA